MKWVHPAHDSGVWRVYTAWCWQVARLLSCVTTWWMFWNRSKPERSHVESQSDSCSLIADCCERKLIPNPSVSLTLIPSRGALQSCSTTPHLLKRPSPVKPHYNGGQAFSPGNFRDREQPNTAVVSIAHLWKMHGARWWRNHSLTCR